MDVPPPRLTVLAARDADVAVVLRRGPTDWARLYRWDTAHDRIEAGGWVHARVDGRRADLSPDGRLLVAFVAGHGRTGDHRKDTWVAISRPPWWRALALWFDGSTWSYGGFFPDSSSCAGTGPGDPDVGTVPAWFNASAQLPTTWSGTEWTTESVPLNRRVRDGWTELDSGWWERPLAAGGAAVLAYGGMATRAPGSASVRAPSHRRAPGRASEVAIRMRDDTLVPLGDDASLDVDLSGRALVGRAGRLEVHTGDGSVTAVADLGDDPPNPAPAPGWAAAWPSPSTRRRAPY